MDSSNKKKINNPVCWEKERNPVSAWWTVSDTHSSNAVQLCWSMEMQWGWYSRGIAFSHTHLLLWFRWAARISGMWVLLLVQKMLKFNFWIFPASLYCLCGFRTVPFMLIPCLVFALWVFTTALWATTQRKWWVWSHSDTHLKLSEMD